MSIPHLLFSQGWARVSYALTPPLINEETVSERLFKVMASWQSQCKKWAFLLQLLWLLYPVSFHFGNNLFFLADGDHISCLKSQLLSTPFFLKSNCVIFILKITFDFCSLEEEGVKMQNVIYSHWISYFVQTAFHAPTKCHYQLLLTLTKGKALLSLEQQRLPVWEDDSSQQSFGTCFWQDSLGRWVIHMARALLIKKVRW